MEKIDRLGWAAGLCFTAYGVRVGIRVNDSHLVSHFPEYLPPGWKPARSNLVERLYSLRVGGDTRGIRGFHLVYAGAARVARTHDLDEALLQLESDLHLYVAEKARRRLFVHAGVVSWNDRAIVLPGRTMSGKTTLVAALVRAGANYYSDEYAVFDARGRVYPYPRPLSVRGEDGRARKCAVQELGGRPGTGALPVGLVAVTHYRPGARWRPRRLPAGPAVLALLSNTVAVRRRPQDAVAVLRNVALNATAVEGARGEAEEVAKALLRAVGD